MVSFHLHPNARLIPSITHQVAPVSGRQCRGCHAALTLLLPLSTMCRNKPGLLSFNSRVNAMGVGYVKLERDLPYNVSTAWKPALHTFERECLTRTR